MQAQTSTLAAVLDQLPTYSRFNTAEILHQLPTAQAVAPFSFWLKVGYPVTKGQKAIRIFAPVLPTEDKPKLTFRRVPVFDISQTAAAALLETAITCPTCGAPMIPADRFCPECGAKPTDPIAVAALAPIPVDYTSPADWTPPKSATAYTIATDAGTVIAEVTHTDLTTTPDHTDILTAPMAQALANTAKRVQTQARQYVADRKAARKGEGKRSRWEIQDDEQRAAIEESIRILVLPDGSILTGGLLENDYDAIPSGCASTPFEAVFMAEDARFLASCLKQTKQARMTLHDAFLVIETPSAYPGKWDTMRFACSFADANHTRTGWPVRETEPVAA